MYEISKSFDFIEITLISGDFTDFIEITLIVKSRKCLHTTRANSDIFATWTCHVAYTSAHVRTCETSSEKPEVKPLFGLHRAGFTRSESHFGLHLADFTRPTSARCRRPVSSHKIGDCCLNTNPLYRRTFTLSAIACPLVILLSTDLLAKRQRCQNLTYHKHSMEGVNM